MAANAFQCNKTEHSEIVFQVFKFFLSAVCSLWHEVAICHVPGLEVRQGL